MVGVGGGSGVVYGYGVLCSSADQISVGKGVPCDVASGLFASVGVLSAVLGILGRVLGSKGEQAIAISNMTIITMAKETDILGYLFFFSFVSFPAVRPHNLRFSLRCLNRSGMTANGRALRRAVSLASETRRPS